MNVISLFNGMGTLRQAMHDLNIKVDKYYSSEIKPYAIELQQHHFPDVIQVGDINNWKQWDIDWKTIDFIGSGSPCQDLSGAGKRAGINGDKSSLFFVFVELLEYVKNLNPNVLFLQENVGSANKLDIGIMSRELGVYPVRINSSLLTAQQRDRYYWTNIKTKETMFDVVSDIPQPSDKGILLKDIIENGFVDRDKARAILQSESRLNTDMKKLLRRYKTTGFGNVVYCVAQRGRGVGKGKYTQQYEVNLKQKSNTLTLVDKDNFLFNGEDIRPFTKIELCRLQGFPDDYCDILSRNKAASLLGDGWTLPMIIHILSFLGEEKIKQKE
jgi:DNA (cytosine-5)-methyltransferase 1